MWQLIVCIMQQIFSGYCPWIDRYTEVIYYFLHTKFCHKDFLFSRVLLLTVLQKSFSQTLRQYKNANIANFVLAVPLEIT